MRTRRFLWVMLIPFVVVLIIMDTVGATFIVEQFEEDYIEDKQNEILRFGDLLVANYQLLYNEQRPNEIIPLFEKFAEGENIRITIISTEGVVEFDSKKDEKIMENHGSRPEVKSALYGKASSSLRYSNELKVSMLYVAIPLRLNGDVIGVIRTSYPLAKIKDRKNAFIFEMIKIGILSLICGVVIAYILSRSVARSLERMKEGAERFGRNEFDVKIEDSSITEVSKTIKTLNYISSEISDRIAALDKERIEKNLVLESMSEGVIALDNEAYIMYANSSAERIFEIYEGLTPGTLLHASIRVPEVCRVVESCLEDGEPEQESMLELIPSGRNVLMRVVLLKAEAGVLLVFHDLTQILRLERTRQDFVANVSHELRTPITSIVGFVETLLDGAIDDKESSKRFLNIISEQSRRMAQIIDDLLVLSRLDSGKEMVKERLPLGIIISSSVALTSELFNKRGVKLNYSYKGEDEIVCHPHLLEQAVINLLTNAARYSEIGSEVWIDVKYDKTFVKISIKDQGIGIAKECQERIFERFYRTDKARSRTEGGTGLGLAIVKHIALLHDGSVEVDSHVGIGSTFTLSFPVKR